MKISVHLSASNKFQTIHAKNSIPRITMHGLQCIEYNAKNTMHIIQCIQYDAYSIMHIIQFVLFNANNTMNMIHCIYNNPLHTDKYA